jgi:hypothetical protein
MVHAKVIGFANGLEKKSKVSDFPYGLCQSDWFWQRNEKKSKVSDFPYGSSQSNWFWQGNEKKSKVIGFDDGTSWNVWGKPRRKLF